MHRANFQANKLQVAIARIDSDRLGENLFRDLNCLSSLLRFPGQRDTKVGKKIRHKFLSLKLVDFGPNAPGAISGIEMRRGRFVWFKFQPISESRSGVRIFGGRFGCENFLRDAAMKNDFHFGLCSSIRL